MDWSTESFGCCEYRATLWEELFEHTVHRSTSPSTTTSFGTNRCDKIQMFSRFVVFAEKIGLVTTLEHCPTSSVVGPDYYTGLVTPKWRSFERRDVWKRSRHRSEYRPGSRYPAEALSCLTFRVTINLMFAKSPYLCDIAHHLFFFFRTNYRILVSVDMCVSLRRPHSRTRSSHLNDIARANIRHISERSRTACLILPQECVTKQFSWTFSVKNSTEYVLQLFLVNEYAFFLIQWKIRERLLLFSKQPDWAQFSEHRHTSLSKLTTLLTCVSHKPR